MSQASRMVTCLVSFLLTDMALRASDPVGIYAIVDKVVFEPSAEAPERAQIWGAFSIHTGPGMGDTYKPPVRGFLYYSVDPGNVKATLSEWSDLSELAGKDECVGFASRFKPTGSVRGGCEEPVKPDVYPIALGLTRFRSNTEYQPIADLLSLARPLQPQDGSRAVPPGPVTLLVRNILTPEHADSVYQFELHSNGLRLDSADVKPGEDNKTSWTPSTQLEAGREYSWRVWAVDGKWQGQTASACFQLPFLRGDANGDLEVDLSDAVFDLLHLFAGGKPPQPLAAGDMDGSGGMDVTDPVYLLMYLFQGGQAPPPPFPQSGLIPTSP